MRLKLLNVKGRRRAACRKMRPFAFQKAVFRAARGGLLQRERPPLARPCAPAGHGGLARLRRRLAGTPSSGLAAGGRGPLPGPACCGRLPLVWGGVLTHGSPPYYILAPVRRGACLSKIFKNRSCRGRPLCLPWQLPKRQNQGLTHGAGKCLTAVFAPFA